MIPYSCRRATAADLTFMALSCEQAQADYWGVLKQPVAWTPEIRQRVIAMYPLVAYEAAASKTLLGVLLLDLRPPEVVIHGWATARTLTARQRIGAGLSMLIGGYQPCVDAGAVHGVGEVEVTNTPVVDTLRLVDKFRIQEHGWEPSLAVSARRPHFYKVDVDINPEYLEAVKKALESL